jgi:nucleoside-diphosphate-sugar epimerase
MKIIITGNMGYVGSVLVSHLRSVYPKSTIVGIDQGFFGHCLTTSHPLPERHVDTQHFMDVRNIPDIILKDADTVIQLAAISNDPMGEEYKSVTIEVNYEASVRLAKQAKSAGVRTFVFASSCSVYGFAEGTARNEKSELNPLTAYARSKINTEKAIQDLADDDFVITSLRFPTACGMSDRLRLDLVLNDFVAAAISSNCITILSDGTPWRPLIDVKDMARAIEWGISRNSSSGGAFLAVNAGRTEWNYQIRELAEAVRGILPAVQIDINPNAQPDKRSYRVDFSLYAQLAPNHQPRIGLTQSIQELKEGLEHIGFKEKNFRETHYMRLRVLASLREKGLLNGNLEWVNRE